MQLTSLQTQFGDASYGSLLSRCYLDACRGPVQLLKVLHLSGGVNLHVEIRSGLLFLHQFDEHALLNNALCVNLEELEVLDCLGQCLDSLRCLHLALLSKRGILHLNWHRSGATAVSFFDEFLSAALGQFGTGDHISTGAFRWSALVNTNPNLFFIQPFRERDVSARVTSGAMGDVEQVVLGFHDGTVAIIDSNTHTILSTNPAPTSNFLVKLLSLDTTAPNPILSLAVSDGVVACINSLGVLHVWNREATRIIEHPLVAQGETVLSCSLKLINHGSRLAVGVNFADQGLRSVVVTAESTFSLQHSHAQSLLAEHVSGGLTLESFTTSLLDVTSCDQKLCAIWAVTLHYLSSGISCTARVLHVVTQDEALVHFGQCVDASEARLAGTLSQRQLWQVLTSDRYPLPAVVSAWQVVSGIRIPLSNRLQLAQRILSDIDHLVDQGSSGGRNEDLHAQLWKHYTSQLCLRLQDATFDFFHSVFAWPAAYSQGSGGIVCACAGAMLGILPIHPSAKNELHDLNRQLRQSLPEVVCAQFREDCLRVLVHTEAKEWMGLMTAQALAAWRRLAPLLALDCLSDGLSTAHLVQQALQHCRKDVSWISPRWQWATVCNHIESCVKVLQAAAILLAMQMTSLSRLSQERQVKEQLHHVLQEWSVWLCLQSYSRYFRTPLSAPLLQEFLNESLPASAMAHGPLPVLRPQFDDSLNLYLMDRCPTAALLWTKAATALLLKPSASFHRHNVRNRVLRRPVVDTQVQHSSSLSGLVTAATQVLSLEETQGQAPSLALSLSIAFPMQSPSPAPQTDTMDVSETEEAKNAVGASAEHGQVSSLYRSLGEAARSVAPRLFYARRTAAKGGNSLHPAVLTLQSVQQQLRSVCSGCLQRPGVASLDGGLLVLSSLLASTSSTTTPASSSSPSSSSSARAASPLALSIGYLAALQALESRVPNAMLALLSLLCCLGGQTQSLQRQLARDLVDDVILKIVQKGCFHDLVFPSTQVRRLCEQHKLNLEDDLRRAALLAGDPTSSLDLVCALHLYRQHWTSAAEIALHQLTSTVENRTRPARAAAFRMILSVAPPADRTVLLHHFQQWFRGQANNLPLGEVADLAFLMLHAMNFGPPAGDNGAGGIASTTGNFSTNRLDAAELSQALLAQGIWNLWLPLVAHSMDARNCSELVHQWLGRSLPARPNPRAAFICALQAPLQLTPRPATATFSNVLEMCHVLWQNGQTGGQMIFEVLNTLLCSYPDSEYCQELVSQMATALDHNAPATKRLLQVLVRWNAISTARQVAARCLERSNGLDFLCTSVDELAQTDPVVQRAVTKVLERALLR